MGKREWILVVWSVALGLAVLGYAAYALVFAVRVADDAIGGAGGTSLIVHFNLDTVSEVLGTDGVDSDQ